MKKKFISLLVAIFLCISPFVGPLYAEANADEPSISYAIEQKLEVYVKLLCSDIFGGRKTGSLGNDVTVGWLGRMLEDIGITPYENDYRMGFNTRCYTHQKLEITVYEKDGTVRSLVSGEDFYISLTASFNEILTKDDASFIPIGSTEKKENSNYVFQEVQAFKSLKYIEKLTPQNIQVTSDTFRYLTEAEIEYIHIVNEVSMEIKEAHNVVGIIPGTKSDKAVILSAHFDHMGQLGKSIFRGAMDNASGTATLLYLAEALSLMAEENPFDFDIIIAFCNDEENGLNGSAALAPLFKESYTNLFNLNIDCVGIGGSDNVYVLSDTTYRAFVEDIKMYLDMYDLLYIDDDSTFTYHVSDWVSFTNNGIPSVNFISAFIEAEVPVDYFHTTSDTYDKLDYSQIVDLCEMIIGFISDNGSKLYDEKTSLSTNTTPTSDNIALKFFEVYQKILLGDEAYFDEELVSYMFDTGRSWYTCYEYMQISEGISILREYNDYYLGFIKEPDTLPITRLIYVRNVSSPELGAVQISLASHFTYDEYSLTAIEGMDGYYIVTLPRSPDIILGFIYADDDNSYFFEIGEFMLRISSRPVDFLIMHYGPNMSKIIQNLDHLKALINELNPELFIELWKEYNLNQ